MNDTIRKDIVASEVAKRLRHVKLMERLNRLNKEPIGYIPMIGSGYLGSKIPNGVKLPEQGLSQTIGIRRIATETAYHYGVIIRNDIQLANWRQTIMRSRA